MINYCSQNEIKRLLYYDNGKLKWKIKRPGSKGIDTEAGWIRSDGYIQICINKKLYYAHRLVWLYFNGYLPENGLDHINKNPRDNRIENLREVSQVCNARNAGVSKGNKTGVRGIHWSKQSKKWAAQIRINYKTKALGFYNDFSNAVAARLAAEQAVNWKGCDSSSSAYKYMRGLHNES